MFAARLVLGIALLAAAWSAIRAKSLIHAAIALALGNSSLALYFFTLRAPYAASVQLSIGGGVVGALFLLALSLTESMRGSGRER
jgi:NADH:ubiquinone oxidoreductase subunit 6 (subunit J)